MHRKMISINRPAFLVPLIGLWLMACLSGGVSLPTQDSSTHVSSLATATVAATAPVQQVTLSSRPSQTLLPTLSLTPTALPPTPTSAPSMPASLGTLYPQPVEVISTENAAHLALIARWGNGKINFITLSPDGASLAAASDLGIYLFDASTLKQLHYFPTSISINCLVFSPDGRTLASGSNDGVLLWELASGQVRGEMGGDRHDFVASLAFSPDGSLLASGTDYATIDLYDPISGKLLYSLEWDPYFWTDALAFSPDGKYLASGQHDSGYGLGTVLLWDLGTKTSINRYDDRVRAAYPGSLAFSPDGKTLAFATSDAAITLWDPAQNTVTQLPSFETGWVISLSFSPDGNLLATGTQEGNIYVWDIAAGKLQTTLTSQGGEVNSLDFSADGRALFSGSPNGPHLWEVASGTLLQSNLSSTALGAVISFSPDGKKLATYTNDVVTVWDAVSGASLHQFSGGVFTAISSDWSLLAAASVEDRGIMQLYDLDSGQLLRQISHDSNNAEISGMAFSPDARILAQVEYSFRNVLLLWDPTTGALRHKLQGDDPFSSVIAISPDGRTLATVAKKREFSTSTTIQFWELASGAKLEQVELEGNMIRALAYSPDGNLLAIQTFDTIFLWDPETRTTLYTLDHKVNSHLAFSPDGKLLAAGGMTGDPIVTLWDVSSGAQLALLAGHNLETTGLVFSPDGRTLVSSSEEGTILFWGISP